jgi:MSHA biogenesis protein MshO
MRRFRPAPSCSSGLTLVELIVGIVVLGILLALTSMFVRNQVESYMDVVRRAELVDVADGALRRMARDLQAALPNSPRVPGANCIEYIPTKAGGRYRAEPDGGGNGDPLDFSAADASFAIYGTNPGIADDDWIAVYNLGIPGADAYAGDNIARVAGAPVWNAPRQETEVAIESRLFPLASASHRFHVIPAGEPTVSYVCVGAGTSAAGDGQGTLFRRVGSLPYPATGSCPAVAGGTPVLATNVARCSFAYTPGSLQRMGLVDIELEIARAGERIVLRRQVNVTNTP